MSAPGAGVGVSCIPAAVITPETRVNPSMVTEQATSNGGAIFTAFQGERASDRRWLYIMAALLVPLLAVLAAWLSTLGQPDVVRIVTAHGIKAVNPGMSQQEVVGLLGHPIGKETRAGDGADCFMHGMFSMTEPQTTVYVLCYLSGQLHDVTTRRYSLWAQDPDGAFEPAGVQMGDAPAKAAPASKP
jgi:hypothetical protein